MDATGKTTPLRRGCWRTTIDSWVQNPEIRRHALFALAMVLAACVLMVGLASEALAVATQNLLPSMLAKAIGGSVVTAGTTGTWLYRRRVRRRRAVTEAVHPAEAMR
jgi:hypothetical protein